MKMWKSPHSRPLPKLGERPILMGILNVTSDSFSDGGKYLDPKSALAHALELQNDGADIIDIGAESTRPQAKLMSESDELEILLDRLSLIRRHTDLPISVDTYKPSVAKAAINAGADIINDVYACRQNGFYPMAALAEKLGAPLILTHNSRQTPIDENLGEEDFLCELKKSIRALLDDACNSGLDLSRIILDAGVGFGKTSAQNFYIVKNLLRLREFDCPILLGVSRKSFLTSIVGDGIPERDFATAAISALVAANFSADILRVHDVKANAAAIKTGFKFFK